MNGKEAVLLLKLLSDKTRYEILGLLSEKGGELCVRDIALKVGISHSAVSHQLEKLRDNDIVSPRRDGQTMCYTLNQNASVKRLLNIMNELS